MKSLKFQERHSLNIDVDAVIAEIKSKRDPYLIQHGLSVDDLWILIDQDTHSALLTYSKRTSEGDGRITRQCVLGMHAIHDNMKQIWIIPKHRLPEEQESYEETKRRRKRGLVS